MFSVILGSCPGQHSQQNRPVSKSPSAPTPKPGIFRRRCCMPRRSCTTPRTPPRPMSPCNWAPVGPPSAACSPRRNGAASSASRSFPLPRCATGGLADRLARALSLATVYLSHPLPNPGPGRTTVDVMGGALAPAVGRALSAAGLLAGDVLLVSSGRTVYEVAQYELVPLPGVVVAPTVGGNDQPEEWYQTNEITRLVANRLGGQAELSVRARTARSRAVSVAAQRPEHPARAAPVAACALCADGYRRTSSDAFGHPQIRADRILFAAFGRRRRLLALLRPGRRRGRVRWSRPADRRGTRSACATFRSPSPSPSARTRSSRSSRARVAATSTNS